MTSRHDLDAAATSSSGAPRKSDWARSEAEERLRPENEPAGLAHVGALSFLASRATPSGSFWVALAGGTALARAGQRLGARRGYGASFAAMIQTVAYLGPARLNGPLTQAITAPAMGALERRGVGAAGQFLACAAGRLAHNALATAFFIWVILGGLDAYVGTYDELLGWFTYLPRGPSGALLLTAASAVLWTVVASAVQTHVYRRGLRRWPREGGFGPDGTGGVDEAAPVRAAVPRRPPRFDPRAVAVAAVVAFGLLLSGTEWPLLGAVAAWLVAAWTLSRPDRDAVPAGVVLTLLLAGGSLVFSLTGGLGLAVGVRRATRAALLVLVATWWRAAAGSTGVREVARRSLGRLRRVPAARESATVLDSLGAGGPLAPSGRALLRALGAARKRPLAIVDAVLGWVVVESARFVAPPAEARARLRLGAPDVALVAAAAAPALVLVLGE